MQGEVLKERENIKLTQLDISRADDIIEFNKLTFPNDYWKEQDIKDLLSDKKSIYYAILDGNKIVANVFIYNWKGEKDFIKIMDYLSIQNIEEEVMLISC